MIGPKLVGIIHKKPKEGGISAVGGTGSIYTYYGPDEKKFANLTKNFLEKDIDQIMPALGLEKEPIPLWWTGDFINASPEGTLSLHFKPQYFRICIGFSERVQISKFPMACQNQLQTLRGSYSALSTPIFASKYSLE